MIGSSPDWATRSVDQMQPTASVVIIGGGIQGTSTAYHLSRMGVPDVLLLEMNTIGSGSSGRSAAMIIHSAHDWDLLPLTRISMQSYLNFEDDLQASPGFEPIGNLSLVTRSMADRVTGLAEKHLQMGVPSAALQPEEILSLVPGLNVEDLAFGLYTPGDGVLDPHSIYSAFVSFARRRGLRINQGVKAIGLEVRAGRVTGVMTTKGLVATRCVVNAAGFLAREVASWAGQSLPITNLKRNVYVLRSVPGYSGDLPFVYDLEAEWYFRREGENLLIGMGKTPCDEEDPQVDMRTLEDIIEHALHRAPPLAEAKVIRGWAGLRSLTPDSHPILGEASSVRGFYNCCGWGGHGVMHAPAGGMLTAELIVDGHASSADISPFTADRFAIH